jgi:hypothetical protein
LGAGEGEEMAFLLLPVTWLSWGVAYPVTGIALCGFDVLTLRVLVQALGAAALAGQGTLSGISFKVEREIAASPFALLAMTR